MKIQSKYTDKKVHPHQYVLEKLCENKAEIKNEYLPPKFWNQKKWKNYFVYQNSILRTIIPHVDWASIIQAINETNTYSLKSPIFKKKCWEIFLKRKRSREEKIELAINDKCKGFFGSKKTNLDLL